MFLKRQFGGHREHNVAFDRRLRVLPERLRKNCKAQIDECGAYGKKLSVEIRHILGAGVKSLNTKNGIPSYNKIEPSK
jgi:phage-related protein